MKKQVSNSCKVNYASLSKAFCLLLLAGISMLALSRCSKSLYGGFSVGGKNRKGFANPGMLLLWNDAATQAVTQVGLLSPGGPLPPMPESRIYAMVNLAMYDAVNSIEPVNKPYALLNTLEKGASTDAAIAQGRA